MAILFGAAYDTSLHDLPANWLPVAGLVLGAVGLTKATVAVVVHLLVPDIPWAAAVALGAAVAPPDITAASPVSPVPSSRWCSWSGSPGSWATW